MYDEDDLIGIKHLFYAVQYAQLKYDWAERLIMAGFDDRMAHKWVAEMGHVVDEIERSLRYLIDDFKKTVVTTLWKMLLDGQTILTIYPRGILRMP
jgi:hypothetical protein